MNNYDNALSVLPHHFLEKRLFRLLYTQTSQLFRVIYFLKFCQDMLCVPKDGYVQKNGDFTRREIERENFIFLLNLCFQNLVCLYCFSVLIFCCCCLFFLPSFDFVSMSYMRIFALIFFLFFTLLTVFVCIFLLRRFFFSLSTKLIP